ncbi:MAG: hypothetical protein WBA97_04775 [Actinophytocola sp.]|uniref:hypothetical protein n=1 Tax=Actinophytocola sp. TaxID=1872138 RepID=UPI003C70FF99
MEFSRLLRRGLLVAAVAAAGWLISAVFAGSASAEESPADQSPPQQQQHPSGGLLGGLVGTLTGLTDALADVTGAVLDTTSTLLSPITQPGQDPLVDVQESPHADDWTGTSGTARQVAPPAPAARTPLAPAPQPVARTKTVAAEKVAAEPVAAPTPSASVPAPHPATPPRTQDEESGRQAGTGSAPEPVKTPAGPSTPGTAVSAAHDYWSGARGTHGVLVSHATLAHPADAGFSTRSRAVSTAGRGVGLPVSTPD